MTSDHSAGGSGPADSGAALSAAQQRAYDTAHARYAARFNAAAVVEVVPTKVEHFEPIRGLTLRAYEPVVPSLYTDGYADELTDLEARAETTTLFTALLNGQIVGAVTYVGNGDHELHSFADKDAAYIRYLAVDPSAQGVGAGRLLAERCIAEAIQEGKARIGLHTLPSMSSAIAMYNGLGFERSVDNDGLSHVGYDGEAPAFVKDLSVETSG